MGRTGKFMCVYHENVRPDILLMGKSITGGFYPASAILCDDEIHINTKPG